MASIKTEASGAKRIMYYPPSSMTQRGVPIGNVSKAVALSFKAKIEKLVELLGSGAAMDNVTAASPQGPQV